MRECRERKREQELARVVVGPSDLSPAEQILAAIERGTRTREGIELETELHEDLISDVLAGLAFDQQAIRIVKVGEQREFHLVVV